MVSLAPHRIEGLPDRWIGRLHRQLHALFDQAPKQRDPRMAAVEAAWKEVELIADAARGLVLPINATDEDVRVLAKRIADECAGEAARFATVDTLRAQCERIASRYRIAPLNEGVEDSPAIRRYIDVKWWTRRLREAHGRDIETSAIKLGIVHRRADVYVSNENLRRRQQQNQRNARILENTIATNEDGEQFSLADLAAKSVSNKAIRRGELMLRIRGMEEVAKEGGDVALFAVLTCPSRMHAVRESGRPNPKHDGTTPRQAQAWHAGQWKLATAALHRLKVRFYGARTVEPHHDGCPHWNVLLFVPPAALAGVEAILTRYWLESESPDEAGAREHRIRLTRIDPSKGSATAYIAKYIAKGIDGYGVGEDLFGNPIIETTSRIEAWARTWGIRQFQTMCSPSVMVWRELRRIKRDAIVDANGPDELAIGWNAAQRFGAVDGDEEIRADFAAFINACGGPRVKRRSARLRLDMKPGEGETRYGEPRPAMPAGVVAAGTVERVKLFDGIAVLGPGAKEHRYRVARLAVVASVRRVWAISSRPGDPSSLSGFGVPRTRVNNYTRSDLGEGARCWSEVDDLGDSIGSSRVLSMPRVVLDDAETEKQIRAFGGDAQSWRAHRELREVVSAW